jgi:hypothetical protein
VLPAPTGSSTATVSAGQPATFNLRRPIRGIYRHRCDELYEPARVCSLHLHTGELYCGIDSDPVTLSISRQQTVVASVRPGSEVPDWPEDRAKLAALFALPAASRRFRRSMRKVYLLLWLIGCTGTVAFIGCGGSGGTNNSNPPSPAIQKTPSDTYTITVVGTSITFTPSTNVTLVVQ